MKYSDYFQAALLLSIAGISSPLVAQDTDEDAETETKTIAETTENSDRFDGFFTLYRDRAPCVAVPRSYRSLYEFVTL